MIFYPHTPVFKMPARIEVLEFHPVRPEDHSARQRPRLMLPVPDRSVTPFHSTPNEARFI
jgi:hypothetical protein